MEWQKTPEATARLFDGALPEDPRLQKRKMFGYPAAFVGGNMAASTFGDRIVVRLPETEYAAALEEGAEPFEPMPGRSMRGYVVVPQSAAADPGALRGWIGRALAYAGTLPAKEAGSKKRAR